VVCDTIIVGVFYTKKLITKNQNTMHWVTNDILYTCSFTSGCLQ